MNEFQFHLRYRAYKLHFTTDYDIIKYQGKVKGDSLFAQNKFEKSPQKRLYTSLLKFDCDKFLVSNFIINPNYHITELNSMPCKENYRKWVDRFNILSYNTSQELSNYDSLKELKSFKNNIPLILNDYLKGSLSAESVVIIDQVILKLDEWAEIDHPLIQDNILKLRKYRSFIKLNNQSLKKIFQPFINSKQSEACQDSCENFIT